MVMAPPVVALYCASIAPANVALPLVRSSAAAVVEPGVAPGVNPPPKVCPAENAGVPELTCAPPLKLSPAPSVAVPDAGDESSPPAAVIARLIAVSPETVLTETELPAALSATELPA